MEGGGSEVLSWPEASGGRREAIDRLHDALATPVDACLPWLDVWVRNHPQFATAVVLVRADDGLLAGLAPIATRRVGPARSVVAVGHGFSDHSSFVYRDEHVAAQLGRALRAELGRSHRPWFLTVDRLAADAGSTRLSCGVSETTEFEDLGVTPIVVVGERVLRAYETRNSHQAVTRARHRLAEAGRSLDLEIVTEPRAVRELLPAILEIHAARDLQLRGVTALDDPIVRAQYEEVLRTMAEGDQVWLLLVRIDAEIAAFVLGVADRRTLRVIDNRVAPDALEWSAGTIANAAALEAVVTGDSFDALDWGPGDQRYKRSSATVLEPSRRLLAWSSPATRRAWRAARAAPVRGHG